MKTFGFGQRPGQIYRGQPSRASVSITMAFAGHMSIELLQPEDGRNEPGMIELIPATPGFDDMLSRYWRAACDSNGEDPVRAFG